MLVEILVGAGTGLVSAGMGLLGVSASIKRKNAQKRKAKLAYKEKQESEINLLKEAIRGLASNNGQQDASYIKNLALYEVDEETTLHVLKAHNAKKGNMSDKETKKLDKALKKSL